jgi:hypothetical protein
MFEKVGQHAEELATRLPRRAFFSKVAQTALPLTAAFSGLLALPNSALAIGRTTCCFSSDYSSVCRPNAKGKKCPNTHPNKGSCPPGQSISQC